MRRQAGILPARCSPFAAARPRCCSLRGPHSGKGGSPPHPASTRPPLPRRPPRCGCAAPPAPLSPGCGIEGIPAAAKASPAACAAEPARRRRAAGGAGGGRRPHGIVPIARRRHRAAAAKSRDAAPLPHVREHRRFPVLRRRIGSIVRCSLPISRRGELTDRVVPIVGRASHSLQAGR